MLATKTREGDFFSVGGMFAAAAFTLAGAGGQIWVGYQAGHGLDLGGAEDWLVAAMILAFCLLALYGFRALRGILNTGLGLPPAAAQATTDALLAGKDALEATGQQAHAVRLKVLAEDLPAERPAGAPPARRAALL